MHSLPHAVRRGRAGHVPEHRRLAAARAGRLSVGAPVAGAADRRPGVCRAAARDPRHRRPAEQHARRPSVRRPVHRRRLPRRALGSDGRLGVARAGGRDSRPGRRGARQRARLHPLPRALAGRAARPQPVGRRAEPTPPRRARRRCRGHRAGELLVREELARARAPPRSGRAVRGRGVRRRLVVVLRIADSAVHGEPAPGVELAGAVRPRLRRARRAVRRPDGDGRALAAVPAAGSPRRPARLRPAARAAAARHGSDLLGHAAERELRHPDPSRPALSGGAGGDGGGRRDTRPPAGRGTGSAGDGQRRQHRRRQQDRLRAGPVARPAVRLAPPRRNDGRPVEARGGRRRAVRSFRRAGARAPRARAALRLRPFLGLPRATGRSRRTRGVPAESSQLPVLRPASGAFRDLRAAGRGRVGRRVGGPPAPAEHRRDRSRPLEWGERLAPRHARATDGRRRPARRRRGPRRPRRGQPVPAPSRRGDAGEGRGSARIDSDSDGIAALRSALIGVDPRPPPRPIASGCWARRRGPGSPARRSRREPGRGARSAAAGAVPADASRR